MQLLDLKIVFFQLSQPTKSLVFSFGYAESLSFTFCWQIQFYPRFFAVLSTLDYIKRLRYCEYLGRYFCQCCHENAQAVVPGRVLRKWDFSKYCVSNFARDLLSKIAGDPLFDPNDINSGLYKKIKALEAVRVRTQAAAEREIRLC